MPHCICTAKYVALKFSLDYLTYNRLRARLSLASEITLKFLTAQLISVRIRYIILLTLVQLVSNRLTSEMKDVLFWYYVDHSFRQRCNLYS